MSASFRLVIEHYQVLRDEAIAARNRAQVELDSGRRMHDTLVSYRDEQRAKARQQVLATSASWLALQSRFADTLDEAIRLQAQRIDELQQRVELGRQAVLRQQQRLKAIETLERQRAEATARRANRLEQREVDERAALLARPETINDGADRPLNKR